LPSFDSPQRPIQASMIGGKIRGNHI
jgi:hypothetical protein